MSERTHVPRRENSYIINRECAENSLVRDFATFHIFFDFDHIPEQVFQWHYQDCRHQHTCLAMSWSLIILLMQFAGCNHQTLTRFPVGKRCSANSQTAMGQKVLHRCLFVEMLTTMRILLIINEPLNGFIYVTPRQWQWWRPEEKECDDRKHKNRRR